MVFTPVWNSHVLLLISYEKYQPNHTQLWRRREIALENGRRTHHT